MLVLKRVGDGRGVEDFFDVVNFVRLVGRIIFLEGSFGFGDTNEIIDG